MRFNPCVRTIKIQKDRKLQVHFIGKRARDARGVERGNGTISRNGVGRGGGGRTERDEPPFINLDRLLNPGFDETRLGAYIHVCHSAAVTRTRTLRTPVLVSR